MSDLVAKNKAVYFTYVVTDENNNVTEQMDMPVGYVHGVPSSDEDLEFLPALEDQMEGKQVGDRVEVVIKPEDGYGPTNSNLIYKDKSENVPEEFRHVGAEAEFKNEHGESRKFIVTEVKDGMVTLDGNHPYAGKTIIIIVTIVEIRDANQDEISEGRPRDMPPTVIH